MVKLKSHSRPYKALKKLSRFVQILYISHNNLGAALHALGDLEGAVSAYDTAISLYPISASHVEQGSVKLLWNLGAGHFTNGDCKRRGVMSSPLPNKPDWRGEEDISDKRLFIPRTGAGDLIQFSRYAAMAVESRGSDTRSSKDAGASHSYITS